MPSSGHPLANLVDVADAVEHDEICRSIIAAARTAMECGMFVEWLESFVGCWEVTRDPEIAARAGLIEWDMIGP